MINYLIIEDEPSAARRLQLMIQRIRPSWSCAGSADSVVGAIDVISTSTFDLIFTDIELSDGDCFEIFRKVDTEVPLIFITAYDAYAIQAFELNSIHYLLKPLNEQRLNQAINKFEQSQANFPQASLFKHTAKEELKDVLISRVGTRSILINVKEVSYFYHHDRLTRAHLVSGKAHLLDSSLDMLIQGLSKQLFFRINRQTIVNKQVIKKLEKASSNRIQLTLAPPSHIDLVVSKEQVSAFKNWL